MSRLFTTIFVISVLSLTLTADAQNDAGASSPGADQRRPSHMGSPYVALDSWVYAALDRLAALGYVQTGFAGLRPWTRLECARLITEAAEIGAEDDPRFSEGTRLYRELSEEFAPELKSRDGASNNSARIESVYARSTSISGRPVTDGYHFAQTQTNNFGRPYGEGTNWYSGLAVRATFGPFAIYLLSEYQKSQRTPQLTAATLSLIAQADGIPMAPAGPEFGISHAAVLDAYLSFNLGNNQISIGRQSLWWGPGRGGPLLFSDNAPPITMIRYDRVSPLKLPGILGFLGPLRTEFFLGRLTGQQFVRIPSGPVGVPGVSLRDQPFIQGQKITVKPTPNLEIGISRTGIFGGPGFPVTLGSFGRSLFSVGNSSSFHDPGDRRAGFDASYRVPGLRDWLVFYTDVFTDDELFPLAYPTHSAWSPGIYLPQLPHLHKLDFRAEGVLTPHRDLFPGFYYFNVHYRSGYTNDRQLLGSWIGRQGSGFQLWSTYWLSARDKVEVTCRDMWVDHEFLRGGTLKDVGAHLELQVRPELSLDTTLQWERWNFALLSPAGQSNVTASLQLTYSPRRRHKN